MGNNNEAVKKMERAFNNAWKKLPKIVGNEVVNFSKENFNRQGFLDSSVQRWRPRRNNKGRGRAILVKSARLKRSIRITKIDTDVVAVGSDVTYAKVHNEGFNGVVNVKGHSRKLYGKSKIYSLSELTKTGRRKSKTVSFQVGESNVSSHTKRMRMPKRQFIGNSQYMVNRLRRVALAHILKHINNA